MTWIKHTPHPRAPDSKCCYMYVLKDAKDEDYYAAYIIETDQVFRAVVPNLYVPPRGQSNIPTGHYTHDTLQEAKDWCVVELVKRRLDT